MLLCNNNQTVITASSDRTIHAWSPHSTTSTAPILVGRHRDYVKSLAWAKYPSLLFSGALDRQIAIWDVGAPNHEVPLLNIDLNKADEWGGVGLEGERGSVYALGVGESRAVTGREEEADERPHWTNACCWNPRTSRPTMGSSCRRQEHWQAYRPFRLCPRRRHVRRWKAYAYWIFRLNH